MSDHRMPKGAVVVGFDGSKASQAALSWAADEAQALGRPLHLIHTLGWPDDFIAGLDIDQDLDDITAKGLELARARQPEVVASAQTSGGGPAAALVHASREASLVVVGGHGHHLARSVIVGTTPVQLAGHSYCPVVVVHDDEANTADVTKGETGSDTSPPTTAPAGERVVVGVDSSESSVGAVQFAFDRASRLGLGLTAVGCWWWEEADAYLAGTEQVSWGPSVQDKEMRQVSEQLAGWGEKYPDVDVKTLLVRARPAPALISESKNAELLVVGTRGRGGFTGLLLGSVSLRVLVGARTPVAVVPPTSRRQAGA